MLILTALLFLRSAQSQPVCDSVYPQLSCGLSYTDETSCGNAGCCWDDVESRCYFGKINGYKYTESYSDESSFGGKLELNAPSGGFKNDFETLNIDFVQENDNRLHMKIIPSDEKSRWEVPEDVLPRPTGKSSLKDASMKVSITNKDIFQFDIHRKHSPQELFYMSKMLVFQDQYVQFVLGTPKNAIATYGFGESTRKTQKLQLNATYALWATDLAAAEFDGSLYGTHPFYIQLLDDGTAHGAFIVNSNAMEMTLHHDDTQGDTIGFQMAGGVVDVYFFNGKNPSEVIQQYLDVIGKPMLIPRWSLGFHNCRWGYENLGYVEEVVTNYSNAQIPLETQWFDIDYMDKYKDFTVDPVNFPASGMETFIENLHARHQHFVPIVDPGIYAILDEADPYPALVEGLEQNVFIKDLNGGLYLGQVWPGATYFPDWFAQNISSYWTKQFVDFHSLLNYSGIWIDMNEVSNFCNADGLAQTCELDAHTDCDDGCCDIRCHTVDNSNKYDYPPYTPHVSQNSMGGKSLAMSAVHQDAGVREYDAHSLYGLMESIETNKAVTKATGKRPFILSRSTFPGSGVHTAHWTGDNAATWDDLSASIITMNTLSLFGISMTGADICGFIGDTTEELCARWIEVGAFSPFSRDHNSVDEAPQELYRWESVTSSAINALTLRYKLLPHLYTLMYQSSSLGLTVMNGLWMHFSSDLDAIATDAQYMWGDSILFTPVLTEGATEVTGYFPKGIWYDLMGSGGIIEGPSSVTMDTPLTMTNVHIRGGSVVPMQEYRYTTLEASTTPYTLIVALDENGSASGSLYVDNGDGIVNEETHLMDDYSLMTYTYENNVLSSQVTYNQYKHIVPFASIEVWGLGDFNSCVATVKNEATTTDYTMNMYTANKASLELIDMNIINGFDMSVSCSNE